jgi:sedoheptulokinase
MRSIILSLDIGTSKIAAAALECKNLKALNVISVKNQAGIPNLPEGLHEQSPEIIFEQCTKLLKEIIDSEKFAPEEVKAVALSGQMHGLTLVDKNLKTLSNLITWCDQRSLKLTREISHFKWPFDRIGCYLHPGYGGATLSVLAKQNKIPAEAKALSIADYVAARLCGAVAIDPTNAASWGIMDIQKKCWDPEIIEYLQIPHHVLPKINKLSEVIGFLNYDLGLPQNVKICSPIGDNQASFIGTCGFNSDSLLLNLGTGGQISLPCNEYCTYECLETRPALFDEFLLVGTSLCGGRSYELLKNFYRDTVYSFTGKTLADEELYKIMDDMILNKSVQALEVDTSFAGTRYDSSACGKINKIGVHNFTPEALSLGTMNGMIKELCEIVPSEIISKFNRVMASGNAVRKSPVAKEIISEILKLRCELAERKEEAVIGAALSAAKVLSLI